MTSAIYWFRQDLRLHDNPSLLNAISQADTLLPVCTALDEQSSHWLNQRVGQHRRAFVAQAQISLRMSLLAKGSNLLILQGNAVSALIDTARRFNIKHVFCEEIAAPEEQAEVAALQAQGLTVVTHWQSSLLMPEQLPFRLEALPGVFSQFRNQLERAGCEPDQPMPAPALLPHCPLLPQQGIKTLHAIEPRSSFPYHESAFSGAESAALAHVQRYFQSDLPQRYKLTRNELIGSDYSTKFSPWLAIGALSPRQIHAELKAHEQSQGANDSTYWIWFELLWRDYFRFLHLQHEKQLYTASGLSSGTPSRSHNVGGFTRWCAGNTGEALVDAAMRELMASGYLSNRLRQLVASYLIHDLGGDYRAGAAWFEAQLLDYDVYSNQGNWLYIAGRGTDPRGGRRFNPEKQTREHDPDGHYRHMWGNL
ncbi:MAG: DASH family cryptochrome [Pseudomonadota bacterium]